MDCEVPAFKGARKITSLAAYPLQYHKNEAKLRAELIDRGKKFVSLQGVHYKSHEGMAYFKKRKQIIKVNINGRIMVDPAIHRRILPNYNISTVKPKGDDLFSDCDSESEASDCSCGDDEEYVSHFRVGKLLTSGRSNNERSNDLEEAEDKDAEPKTKLKLVLDEKEKHHLVRVPVDADGEEIVQEKLEEVPSNVAKKPDDAALKEDKKALPTFTDEEYLIASPVVLGFAFAEKQWLEFTVSGVKDIVWNEGAYESLVLEDNTKAIVKVRILLPLFASSDVAIGAG